VRDKAALSDQEAVEEAVDGRGRRSNRSTKDRNPRTRNSLIADLESSDSEDIAELVSESEDEGSGDKIDTSTTSSSSSSSSRIGSNPLYMDLVRCGDNDSDLNGSSSSSSSSSTSTHEGAYRSKGILLIDFYLHLARDRIRMELFLKRNPDTAIFALSGSLKPPESVLNAQPIDGK
jgi:hypothetical protein